MTRTVLREENLNALSEAQTEMASRVSWSSLWGLIGQEALRNILKSLANSRWVRGLLLQGLLFWFSWFSNLLAFIDSYKSSGNIRDMELFWNNLSFMLGIDTSHNCICLLFYEGGEREWRKIK